MSAILYQSQCFNYVLKEIWALLIRRRHRFYIDGVYQASNKKYQQKSKFAPFYSPVGPSPDISLKSTRPG